MLRAALDRRARSTSTASTSTTTTSRFYSGTEMGPLMPVQQPPPIWVVSNPRLTGDAPADVIERRLEAACRRIVRYGDGWMTCCRAQHPEELVEQLGWIEQVADEHGADFDRLVDLLPGDDEHRRLGGRGARRLRRLHLEVLPGAVAGDGPVATGGPVGTPEQIADWIRTFADAGVDHFICRFGAIDQFGQVERFASEVLPRFAAEQSEVSRWQRCRVRQLLKDAALVVDVCMSVEEGDVVTIICDDDHARRRPSAVAEVVRRARRLAGDHEQRARRCAAVARTCASRWRRRANLHRAMVGSDEVIIITNLEWANRFAHVSAGPETCDGERQDRLDRAGHGRLGPHGRGSRNAIAQRTKDAIAGAGGEEARAASRRPLGTDFHVSIEGRPALEVTPIKAARPDDGPGAAVGRGRLRGVEDFTHGTAVVDGVMLGIGLEGQVKEPIRWTLEGGTLRRDRGRRGGRAAAQGDRGRRERRRSSASSRSARARRRRSARRPRRAASAPSTSRSATTTTPTRAARTSARSTSTASS